ncbi:winged helix DNA-binding domain-containing protein [Longispora sp. K20-0274]|uniref:winged helix DNA-binding domain-containing protein n=1 Tax=Longispora sp. K20-0274 TaxID=3088255 RepID=UPI00399B950D
MEMTWSEVCARRLARHGLTEPVPLGRLAEQVGAMCGAHAQVMSAAELSIGLRVAGLTRDGVRDALWTERTLVKTYGPRGTVHLLPATDLPIWAGALAATPSTSARFPDGVRLSDEQTDEVVAAIGAALADAELTVDQLTEAIVDRTGTWAGDLVMPAFQGLWPRWRQAVATAAHRGALCFGPQRGRNTTYTSPQRWLPGFEPAGRQTALAEVVHRYLYAYGPATPQQFAQWLAVPKPWAAALFAELADGLEQVTVDGTPAWVVAGDTTLSTEPPSGLRLLPYFDAYTVGCHPREKVFPGKAAERALDGGQAGTKATLLIDGVVAGIWHLRRAGRRLAITVEPFGQLSPRQLRELDDEVARIGAIGQGTAELTLDTVTVGGHA